MNVFVFTIHDALTQNQWSLSTRSVALSDAETRRLVFAARAADPQGISMCKCADIQDIYKKVYHEIAGKCFPDMSADDLSELQENGHLSFDVDFPEELCLPCLGFGWAGNMRLDSCFNLTDKHALEELKKAGGDKLSLQNVMSYIYLAQNGQEQSGLTTYGHLLTEDIDADDTHLLSPENAFVIYDAMLLSYFYNRKKMSKGSQSSTGFLTVSAPEKPTVFSHYQKRAVNAEEFGIHINKGRSSIQVPSFCWRGRIAMAQKFRVHRKNGQNVNSFKFQMRPVLSPQFENNRSELIEENRLEAAFSEEDIWYCEMCTGKILSMAISSLLISLEESNRNSSELIPIILHLLAQHRNMIVSCPAVFWRIAVIEKAFYEISQRVFRPYPYIPAHRYVSPMFTNSREQFPHSYASSLFENIFREEAQAITHKMFFENGLCQYSASFVLAAINLYKQIDDNWVRVLSTKYTYITRFSQYFDTLPPDTKIGLNRYLEKSKSIIQNCTEMCVPYIHSMQDDSRNVVAMANSGTLKKNASTTRSQRMFDAVHSALYPEGFYDFRA